MLAMPSVFGASYNAKYALLQKPKLPSWIDGIMLQCQAYEGHYFLTFDNAKGFGTVSIDKLTLNTSSRIKPIYEVLGPGLMMGGNGCQQPNISNVSTRFEKACYTNPNTLRGLAYTAVMDAFGRSILGSIYLSYNGAFKVEPPILNNALLNAKELSFVRDWQTRKQLGGYTLQHWILHSNETAARGLLNTNEPNLNRSLQFHETVEQMFQNLTVSLMSAPALQ